jgi:hypothetical protein
MSNPSQTSHAEDAFAGFFTQAEESPRYWAELAKLEFTEKVLTRGPWPAVTLKSVTFLNSAEEAKKSAEVKHAKAATGNPKPRRVAAKA